MSRSWTIRLPYTRPPLSLNDRSHWATKARLTKEVRNWTREAALYTVPDLARAHVVLHWVPRDRRRRDSDNPFPTLKAAIDGLRDAGIVPDDSSEYVTSAVVIDAPDSRDPHLYIEIQEITA